MSALEAGPIPLQAARVHPTALVDPDTVLGAGVEIGPFAIVGPRVRIGEGSVIGPSVLIERDTEIGADCRIHKGAVLGSDPQDLKFGGEETKLRVGDRTTIREFATLNRGTSASGETRVGSDCLLMAYAHVAHDCVLGDHVILANSVNLGGHVEIGDWAIFGGGAGAHQFVRIGRHAFIGGMSKLTQDVPPFVRASGNPPRLFGLNAVGLERRGIPEQVRGQLKKAYRVLFLSRLNLSRALDSVEERVGEPLVPEVLELVRFIQSSERGIVNG